MALTSDETLRRSISRQIKREINKLRHEVFKEINMIKDSNLYHIRDFRKDINERISLITNKLLSLTDTENKFIREADSLRDLAKNLLSEIS
jgi:hypothetical protein